MPTATSFTGVSGKGNAGISCSKAVDGHGGSGEVEGGRTGERWGKVGASGSGKERMRN